MALLGLAGFLIGIVMFLPAESLWLQALSRLGGEHGAFTWDRAEPAGLFGARVHDARFKHRGLTLHFTEMRISPGLLTPLRVQAVTGEPALTASVSWSNRLQISGLADTSVLLESGSQLGQCELLADLHFDSWDAMPEKGTITVKGLNLALSPKLTLANLNLKLNKAGQDIKIVAMEMDKPFPIQASGSVKLDYETLLESTYDFSGIVVMGKKNRNFQKSGKLKELTKLAQGGGMAGLLR